MGGLNYDREGSRLDSSISRSCSGPGGPSSAVGMATGYGLDGPGIESRWGENFRTCPDRSWGQPSLLYNGYWIFPGIKSGRGTTLTLHHF